MSNERARDLRAESMRQRYAYIAASADIEAEKHREELNALEARCSASRPDRVAIKTAYAVRVQAEAEKHEWEAEHCKMVDDSHAVIKTMEDSEGHIWQEEGRSERAHLVCDSKRPAGQIKGAYLRNDPSRPPDLPRVTQENERDNMDCRELDEAAGAGNLRP